MGVCFFRIPYHAVLLGRPVGIEAPSRSLKIVFLKPYLFFTQNKFRPNFFKLRLGASIPHCAGPSVGRSVGPLNRIVESNLKL